MSAGGTATAAGEHGAASASGRIGLVPCLAFAVGTMVGGGVFTLSGTALNEAGPAAIVSYVMAGVVMLLSALCFVAISSRAAPGDSGYGPVGTILSPAFRFVTMWGFYVNGLTLLTFLVVSFGQYLNQYFVPGLGVAAAGLLAMALLVGLNLGPTDLVGRAETYVVAVKVALLLFFIVWGLTAIGAAHLTPFAPHGARGVVQASALLFTAYTGFNVVTNMAASVRRPERTVPIAVVGSVLISGVIYVGVVLAMLASGVTHFGPAGVSEAAQALMGDWGAYLIAFAACLSTLSGANANVLGTSEIMLRMVAQGDAPPAAGRTAANGHPYISVLLIASVTVVLVLFSNVNNIVIYANVGALVAMIVVDIAALRLALRGWPGVGMRLPGGPVIPIVALLTTLIQFPSLGWPQSGIGLLLVAAGLALYGTRHWKGLGAGAVEEVRSAVRTAATPLGRALHL
ncbi:MAG TPA: APC family permease [Candidatus Dormibacteraeota bacterium]